MLAISGTVTAFFIVYTLFLSGLDRPALAVQAGEPFPTFTVQTSQGTMFTSTDLVGQHAALYVFYRGDWCPFCLSELTQLSVYYDEIRKKNVELFAVSVDPPEASEALRQQLKPNFKYGVGDELSWDSRRLAFKDVFGVHLRIRHEWRAPPGGIK